jgi:RNA recognition motif-containing protein
MNAGFAFIEYANKDSAAQAVDGMNGKMHLERRLKVERAATSSGRGRDSQLADRGPFHSRRPPGRSLYVAGIPPTLGEQELRQHFSTYGRLSHVKVLSQKGDTLAAFVDFDRLDHAMSACEAKHVLQDKLLRIGYSGRDAPGGPYSGREAPRRPTHDMPHDVRDAPPPPTSRYDERAPPPPCYSHRGSPRSGDTYDRSDDPYDSLARSNDCYPPPPRYGSEYAVRDRYDDQRARYDDRRDPPPSYFPRYDDRNDARRYDRDPPPGYDNRGPPQRRYADVEAPLVRERDYDNNRRCALFARARSARGMPPPRALAPSRTRTRPQRAGAAKEDT